MAKWNQLCGLFRGLDASDSGSRKDVAFCDFVVGNQFERFALKFDFAFGNCNTRTEGLVRNVDHLRAPLGADVSKAPHLSATNRNHFTAWLIVIAKIVLLRLSIYNVEKELPELLVTRARAQRLHNIKLEITA